MGLWTEKDNVAIKLILLLYQAINFLSCAKVLDNACLTIFLLPQHHWQPENVQEVVDKEQPSKPLPVFMAGLSMGGLTSILVALKDQSAWQVNLVFQGNARIYSSCLLAWHLSLFDKQ